ncbi:hypothetical protein F5Y16DRAFT_94041 [Xylariaceae sp. FL0255]|nr:hypothetical protein F5Y16DRAFT_94041 [Xylariaceae sp. FL0255]
MEAMQRAYGYIDEEAWIVTAGTRMAFMGKFGATGPEDLKRKLPAGHAKHEKEIQSMVPADRLLRYKIRDGWEPLCKFLGKDVPSVSYPHGNDSGAFERWHERQRRFKIRRALKPWLSYAAVFCVLIIAWYSMRNF